VASATSNFEALVAAELAPTPGRGRATSRIVVACVVATAVVMAFHIPHGHWAIITIFTVSQPNAGASLTKGVQRLIGTFGGGVVGIVVATVFADQPWIRAPLLGVIAIAGLFLSRTTTAPYVGLLGAFTALIVVAAAGNSDPNAAVAVGLWRIVLICIGVTIGTIAQLVLWPDDPEEALLDELTARVDAAVRGIRRCLDGTPQALAPEPTALIQSGLVQHLDLLANAEASHPALRLRHIEQLTLIEAVEHLLTGSLALERAASTEGTSTLPLAPRLRELLARCEQIRDALVHRAPPGAVATGTWTDAATAGTGATHLLPAVREMERALHDIVAAAGGLGEAGHHAAAALPRSPLDTPGPASFFTPAFSPLNHADLAFALKGGLAASICYVLTNALVWPGIETSIWTCLVVAQSSFGAIVQKEILRLVGAILGGVLGMIAIVVAMPNLEGLVGLLVVVAIGSAIAGWIMSGSARIGYAGVQTGLAFGICVVDAAGPITTLTPARDRVLGVLIGILVAGFVYRALGPALASVQMRESMARTLRSLAALARVGVVAPSVEVAPNRGHRWTVYQGLATTMRLHDEAQFEAGGGRPEMVAARDTILGLVRDAQAVFLVLLDLVRHRLNVDLGDRSGPSRAGRRELAAGIADMLLWAAARVEGKPTPDPPDLVTLLAHAEQAGATAATGTAEQAEHLRARLLLYRDLVGTLELLDRDVASATAGT